MATPAERRTSGGAKRKSNFRFSGEEVSAKFVPSIRLDRFVSARSVEISQFTQSIPTRKSLTFSQQRASRCLRRRAGSYRSYKLAFSVRLRPHKKPRLLFNLTQILPQCRAKRRFRRFLMVRQHHGHQNKSLRPKWLETHLWHVKRMHMSEHYGYILADRRCDTGSRAANRWARSSCTLHDASYNSCLELAGPESTLRLLLHSASGRTSSHSDSDQGGLEYCTMIHRPGCFPFGALAPVRVMWRPLAAAHNHRVVWVWVHPDARAEVLQALHELAADASAFGAATILDLSGRLVRLELRGPRALQVAKAVVSPVDSSSSNCSDAPPWTATAKLSGQFWRTIGQVGSPPALNGQAVMLRTSDPRLIHPLPHHRILTVTQLAQQHAPAVSAPPASLLSHKPWLATAATVGRTVPEAGQWRPELADGPMWVPAGRAAPAPAPDVHVHARRARGLVRPAAADTDTGGDEVWVLMVACQGGWDLVLPSGWGGVVFRQLVLCGGRAIGLTEVRAASLLASLPPRYAAAAETTMVGASFPYDFPDTPSHHRHARAASVRLAAHTAVLPPAVRPPPPRCWLTVAAAEDLRFPAVGAWARTWLADSSPEQGSEAKGYFVLRGSWGRRQIQDLLAQRRGGSKGLDKGLEAGLVQVSLSMHGRGLVTAGDAIILPSNQVAEVDLAGFVTSGGYGARRGRSVGMGFLSACAYVDLLAGSTDMEVGKEPDVQVVVVPPSRVHNGRLAFARSIF